MFFVAARPNVTCYFVLWELCQSSSLIFSFSTTQDVYKRQLLPIDCLSVSRIASPADRVTVGQQLLCAIKNRDEQDRIVLTLRELLGTWSENAACFAAGETVVGIVRSVEDYGVFIDRKSTRLNSSH